MSTDLQSLDGIDTVLLDSRPALDYVRSRGLDDAARVYTCSPALADDSRVTSLEGVVDAASIRSLSATIAALGQRLYEIVSTDSEWAERALTIARLAPSMELPAYKALILMRSAENAKSIAAVEPYLPQGHRLVAPWEDLLEGMPAFHGVLRIPEERLPPISPTEEQNASFVTRLRFEGWESIFYRGVTRAGKLAKLLLRRGDILIPAENSLIKEAGWWLAGMGYRPVPIPRKRFTAENLTKDDEQSLNALIGPAIREALSPATGPICAERILAAFIRRTGRAISEYRRASDYWQDVFRTHSRGKPRAVVTNYNVTPSGEALYELCLKQNIAHVAVQHGTGFEYSTILQATPYATEIATCDLYLTYNDQGTKVLRQNPYRRGVAETVGLPSDLAFVARRDSGVKTTPPIMYVSCQALMGNIARPAWGGVTDRESVAWETKIIDEALARLPHRVLFKPYRSVRYIDGNPIHDAARRKENIDVFEDRIDLRYVLSCPRVLVVSHAASTLSWCLLSGLPVVYLDSEVQSPLLPEVREAMQAGTFWFDADAPDFTDRLREFLSRPIEDIEAEWKGRISDKDRLVDRFFGSTDGGAGKRAASAIARLIRSRVH